MKCKHCGGEEFLADQRVYMGIVVDGNNHIKELFPGSISKKEKPHGPYQCCGCGARYEDLNGAEISGPVEGWEFICSALKEASGKATDPKGKGDEDPKYLEQQKTLDEIAEKLGVVCLRPSCHANKRDLNTVLFYTKEDDAYNRAAAEQDAQGFGHEVATRQIPDANHTYRRPFWSFENTDQDGRGSLDFANRGTVDLRTTRWKEALEGHVRLALIRKRQALYVASVGGYLELQEADNTYNDMNREMIEAYKMAHGVEFFGSINFYDEERQKIIAGEKSIYEEYTGQEVFNFHCGFAVPCKDEELERMIREWNKGMPNTRVKIEKITSRIDKLGGIHFVWF